MAKKPADNQTAAAKKDDQVGAPEDSLLEEAPQPETAEAAAQTETSEASAQQDEAAVEAPTATPTKITGKPKPGSVGLVKAKLKARWADGGKPHEPGDVVSMSRATYERLKAHGRVE